jgi:hypothetical protein
MIALPTDDFHAERKRLPIEKNADQLAGFP